MNRPNIKEYWSDGLINHEDDYKDYVEELEKYCDKLEKALDKACEEWDKEVPDCDFLIINHKLCDGKCGSCNSKKRKEYRKEYLSKDE